MNTTQNTRFTAMCKAYDAYRDGDIEGDDLASTVVDYTDEVKLASERAYTRAEVVSAMNAAADMVQELHGYESSQTIRQDDTVNLAINVAGQILDNPDITLDEAIVAEYKLDLDDLDLDEDATPEQVSAATIETVKGWIA